MPEVVAGYTSQGLVGYISEGVNFPDGPYRNPRFQYNHTDTDIRLIRCYIRHYYFHNLQTKQAGAKPYL